MDEQNQETGMLTYGEKAVGLTFNPSGYECVDYVKKEFAKLIDVMEELRYMCNNTEQERLATVAITELQTAQMWVVKVLTWQD